MALRGIDIADWQKGIDPANVDADFVIVKVTGGTWYENAYWREWADKVLESGKLLGLYHYAREGEDDPDAADEAEFFLSKVSPYIGKFIPVLDWEAEALELPQSFAKEWLDTVAEKTGATPWFYAYASNINEADYSELTDYPLWMASYLYKYMHGGYVDDPDQIWDTGDWKSLVAYQYTSTGYVDGYGGALDIDIFYGDRKDWERMCGKAEANEPVNDAGLYYEAHVENLDWLGYVHDGMTAGTTGKGLRLECLHIDPPEGWHLQVRTHSQGRGWETYYNIVHGNPISIGTVGEARRIEMIAIDVIEKPEGAGHIEYRVHQQNVGWKGWTKEGFATGTDGMSARLEAIQMVILPDGE